MRHYDTLLQESSPSAGYKAVYAAMGVSTSIEPEGFR